MATLKVRHFPDNLLRQLTEMAGNTGKTVDQFVIESLNDAVRRAERMQLQADTPLDRDFILNLRRAKPDASG